MDKIKILLADDHQIILDGISSLLLNTGFTVVAGFTSCQDVLHYLQTHPEEIQLVISDISMPAMNGIDLCKNIKEHYSSIKVLMLSMHTTPEAINEVLQAEADGFIVKNCGKKQLLEALHKIHSGGTYFSEEIMPFLYKQIIAEREKKKELAVLSEREIEILVLIAQELTSDEIAAKLFISKKTVDNHRTNMLQKASSKSTIGLVKFAIRNGIVNS